MAQTEKEELIDSIPSRVLIEFRNYVFSPSYIQQNASRFLDNQWVDLEELKAFLTQLNYVHYLTSSDDFTVVGSSPPPEHFTVNEDVKVKVEDDTKGTVVKSECLEAVEGALSDDISAVKLRTIREGDHDVFKILDSDDKCSASSAASAASTSPNTTGEAPVKTEDSDSEETDFDIDEATSEAAKYRGFVGWVPSDTFWNDPSIKAEVYIGLASIRITRQATVRRLECINKLAKCYPVFEFPAAIIVDASDEKYNIVNPETQELYTVDHIIKDIDIESFSGPTGTGQPTVDVNIEPGEEGIDCQRSRLKCKGCIICEYTDKQLLVEHWGINTSSCDRVFEAQVQTKSEEGSTVESTAATFLNIARARKCTA
ncbi:hypothetical protein VNI00_018987 [Paramarasmius palmivorus]|uniref:Uncharacterized protein n=1 Tax=Paramarasmius palmivorus TaxID=297713 RepID=A0AAW0AS21_9AGAR